LDPDEQAEVRCRDASCPYWQGAEPLALNPDIHFDVVIASTTDAPTRASMLKMPLRWTRGERANDG